MNWLNITIVALIGVIILVVLIVRNQKDEKEFEQNLKDDYPKPHLNAGEKEADEL